MRRRDIYGMDVKERIVLSSTYEAWTQ
jgi:hypothetical protein